MSFRGAKGAEGVRVFLIGALSFAYLPDGDDPDTGLLRITLDGAEVELSCSREQYDEFWKEAGP